MDACPTDDRLRLMLDGRLPPEELASVEAHIAGCILCRDKLEGWTSVGGLVRQIVAVATLGAGETEGNLPSVPGFRLSRVLGRGGHGIVYLAWNEATGRDVALKVLRAGWAATDAERRRFRADATALARLSHPNIVPLFSVGEFAGHPYIEMEFLPGGSLAEPGHAPAADLRATVERLSALAKAVHYAHTQGIVHRDLKPGNILIAADGTPKIADFGLAQFDDPGTVLTPSTAVLGTPGYQAPELVAGGRRSADPRTDVYGLGAVAYHWFAGRPPFDGATPYDTLLMTQKGDPIPLRQRRHTVPTDVGTVVMKCLDVDPGRRYPTAAAVAADLDRHLAGEPVSARPPGVWGHTRRKVRRHPRVSLLVVVFAVSVCVSIVGLATLYRRAEANAALARHRLDKARDALRTVTHAREQQFWFPASIEQKDEQPLLKLFDLHADSLADYANDPQAWHESAYAMLQLAHMLSQIADARSVAVKAERAWASLHDLCARHPHPEFAHSYGEACVQLSGHLEAAGDTTRSGELRREAYGITADLVRQFPDREKFLVTHAAFGKALADALAREGRVAEAERHYVEAVRLGRRVVGISPAHHNRREDLIMALGDYATFLNRVYRNPQDYDRLQNDLAQEFMTIRRIAPRRFRMHWGFVNVSLVRASMLDRIGNGRLSDECVRQYLRFVDELEEDNPDSTNMSDLRLYLQREECYRLAGRGDPAATRMYAAYAAAAADALARRPDLVNIRCHVAAGIGFMPHLPNGRADPERALKVLTEGTPQANDSPHFRHLSGILHGECGRFDQAVSALADVPPLKPFGPGRDATANLCRVRVLWLAGRRDTAEREFAELSAVLHADFATSYVERFRHDWVWRTMKGETPPPSWAITDAGTGRALLFRDE